MYRISITHHIGILVVVVCFADGDVCGAPPTTSAVAVAADGRTAVIATLSKSATSLDVWDVKNGKQLFSSTIGALASDELGRKLLPIELQLSPDGRFIAIGKLHRWFLLKRTQRGLETVIDSHKFPANDERRYCATLGFSPDGKILACGGLTPTLPLWSTTSGKIIAQLRVPDGKAAVAIAIARGGKLLALAFDVIATNLKDLRRPSNVELWDCKARKQVSRVAPLRQQIRELVFSPRGHVLVTIGISKTLDDTEVVVWDVKKCKKLRDIQGLRNRIVSSAFSADGELLALADHRGQITVWETKRWSRIWRIEGEAHKAVGLSFGLSKTTLVVVRGRRVIETYNTKTKRRIRRIELMR